MRKGRVPDPADVFRLVASLESEVKQLQASGRADIQDVGAKLERVIWEIRNQLNQAFDGQAD